MSFRESHEHGDDDSSRLIDYYNGRCFSMPHYTTADPTAFTPMREITALTSPRRAADVDRLYRAYLGGELHGNRLLGFPDWKDEQVVRRSGRTNNESWSEEDRKESRRGFRVDKVSGHVSLRGRSESSRIHRHTDKVAGVTRRFRSVTVSDESTSNKGKCQSKKKMKMNKEKGWLSWFGCKSSKSLLVD